MIGWQHKTSITYVTYVKIYSHLSNEREVMLSDFEKKCTLHVLHLFTSVFQKIPPSMFIDFAPPPRLVQPSRLLER